MGPNASIPAMHLCTTGWMTPHFWSEWRNEEMSFYYEYPRLARNLKYCGIAEWRKCQFPNNLREMCAGRFSRELLESTRIRAEPIFSRSLSHQSSSCSSSRQAFDSDGPIYLSKRPQLYGVIFQFNYPTESFVPIRGIVKGDVPNEIVRVLVISRTCAYSLHIWAMVKFFEFLPQDVIDGGKCWRFRNSNYK